MRGFYLLLLVDDEEKTVLSQFFRLELRSLVLTGKTFEESYLRTLIDGHEEAGLCLTATHMLGKTLSQFREVDRDKKKADRDKTIVALLS